MKVSRLIFILILIFAVRLDSSAQYVPQSVFNKPLYDFLDDLANLHIITLNDAIKPYSRKQIAEALQTAEAQKEKLNATQQKQLAFYLKDFNKELFTGKGFRKRLDLFYFKDSTFNITVNPVGGFSYFKNENDNMYRQYAGGEFWATLGKGLSIFGSYRDYTDSRAVADSKFLNDLPGYNYKYKGAVGSPKRGGSFDDTRGGIAYAWKWGHVGVVKDNFEWGSNNHGANIISTKAPSFARLELKLNPKKWFEFNYFHGWLYSEIKDDSAAYFSSNPPNHREVYFSKYFAANMFTVKPFKQFNFSFGNSIVYSDQLEVAMFIPFMFFKSLDHSKTGQGSNYSGQNSQLFFNISSHNIKYTHLYVSLFVDEIAFGRMMDKDEHSNFYSLKAGTAVMLPFYTSATIIAEYTRTNPVTYRHFVNTTTYESNRFNMGHYLRDNAQEIYLGARCMPISGLYISAGYTSAAVGPVYPYTGKDKSGLGLPFLKTKEYEFTSLDLNVKYELLNDIFLSAGVKINNNKGAMANVYTAPFYYGKNGKTTTLFGGFNIGF
ncbi:MAG: hypothetical protein V9G42_11485 [Bacteroidia bacterium]